MQTATQDIKPGPHADREFFLRMLERGGLRLLAAEGRGLIELPMDPWEKWEQRAGEALAERRAVASRVGGAA